MKIITKIKRTIKGENKFRTIAYNWLEYKKTQ